MDEIKPEQVPQYPCYVIALDEVTGTATLDNVPIEPAHGVDLYQAATAAAAAKAATDRLAAVRTVIRSTQGEEWTMIVGANGSTIDTTADPESGTKKPLIRPATVLGGILTLGALGGVTAVGVYLSTDTDQDQTAAPAWEIPGAGEQIPVGLPEGFTGPSDWSVSINDDTAATGLYDGRILTANSDGILSARDPKTAEPVWAGSGAPADLSEIHETTWTGQPVLASYSRGNLNLWPLEEATPGEAVDPEQIPVANEAEIFWDGDTPLVSLGDFIVLVPDDEGVLTEVTIPAGSEPISAQDGHAVSLAAETIYRTSLDGEIISTEFTPPETAEGAPDVFWTIGADALVLAWDAEDPVVTVIDQNTGDTIIEGEMEQLPNQSAEITYNAGAQRAVIGTLSVRYDDDPSLNEIPALSDPVIHESSLYGNTSDGPAVVNLDSPDEDAETYATFNDSDPAPVIVADDAAYVIAPRLDETILYRAAEDQDSGSDTETDADTATDEPTEDEQDD